VVDMTMTELHREAMEFADQARVAEKRGDLREALKWYKMAFAKECDAHAKAKISQSDEFNRGLLWSSSRALKAEVGAMERRITISQAASVPRTRLTPEQKANQGQTRGPKH